MDHFGTCDGARRRHRTPNAGGDDANRTAYRLFGRAVRGREGHGAQRSHVNGPPGPAAVTAVRVGTAMRLRTIRRLQWGSTTAKGRELLEATMGIEPMYRALQALA